MAINCNRRQNWLCLSALTEDRNKQQQKNATGPTTKCAIGHVHLFLIGPSSSPNLLVWEMAVSEQLFMTWSWWQTCYHRLIILYHSMRLQNMQNYSGYFEIFRARKFSSGVPCAMALKISSHGLTWSWTDVVHGGVLNVWTVALSCNVQNTWKYSKPFRKFVQMQAGRDVLTREHSLQMSN